MTQKDDSMNSARIYWLHTLTPLHVGAGRGVGFIDLPIQREKITNWPVVPGSAVKGVLADKHEATDDKRKTDDLLGAAFGRAGDESSNAGALVLADARIVCLPVRSFHGTFAWVTCPDVLRRLKREMDAARAQSQDTLPEPDPGSVCLPKDPQSALKDSGRVYFEEIDLVAKDDESAAKWAKVLAEAVFPGDGAWQDQFKSRFAVVHSDVFNFLCDTGTEVNAHVRLLDQQKTVAKGALWYEECLPAETILAGTVWCDRVFGGGDNGKKTPTEITKKFVSGEHSLQIGGKATVGKGRVRCIFPKEA